MSLLLLKHILLSQDYLQNIPPTSNGNSTWNVYLIVEVHGRRIWAENNTGGKASYICLSLPLSDEE